MTPSSTLSAPVGRRYRFSILRVLLCGVLMAVLVAACLYLYRTAFTFYHARMLDNQSKTFAWFVEQTGFSLPFIVVCIFQYAVYHKHDRRDGVAAQEMFWEILLLAALVYGVFYPYNWERNSFTSPAAPSLVTLDLSGTIPSSSSKHRTVGAFAAASSKSSLIFP